MPSGKELCRHLNLLKSIRCEVKTATLPISASTPTVRVTKLAKGVSGSVSQVAIDKVKGRATIFIFLGQELDSVLQHVRLPNTKRGKRVVVEMLKELTLQENDKGNYFHSLVSWHLLPETSHYVVIFAYVHNPQQKG